MKIHLKQLAQTLPNTPMHLPHTGGETLTCLLNEAKADEALDSYYLCLEGELLIDLPYGDFVHLKPQEAARIEAGKQRKLTPVGRTLLLILRI
ncbi:hypothetical protein [Deinococcus roseus]|uniref:Cupin 2 conserved barrel domain-containing protein n=1 Tax=Deinococcus roseus TaxID=392414 RepID=A0ABQ2CW24_9DEIO|nr:hypothetical protein [Deinococcus roseus]GGJ26379.1 hypothetical protein GCM10008938_10690 [Deinococcus roseus]